MAKKMKVTKIGRGKPLEELVKGSIEYTMDQMRDDFIRQFPSSYEGNMAASYYICDTFADYVVIRGYGLGIDLEPDEYYKVGYSVDGGEYMFAAKDQWEIVQLTYTPAAPLPASQASPPMGESKHAPTTRVVGVVDGGRKPPRRRFEERINAKALLIEAEEGKPRRVRFEKAMTADIVNGNGRRYPASVLEAAIAELRGHLNESAGQGRAIMEGRPDGSPLLGESGHPSDKGGHPDLLETVTKWEEIAFDGSDVTITGRILETSKGKDILVLMEGGVMPGVSIRGYGDGKYLKGEKNIFEVTELHITGFDLVMDPSFENSATLMERMGDPMGSPQQGDEEMTIEELLKLLKERPEVFPAGMNEAQMKKMGEEQLKLLEEKMREALGLDAKANIAESLKTMAEKAKKFDEAEKKGTIEKAIKEATEKLPYGKEMNEQFVEAIKAANPQDEAAVKSLVESKRKEYDALASKLKLKNMGFSEGKGTHITVGSVLEEETGVPEFGRVAFQLTESIRKHSNKPRRDLRKAETASEIFAVRVLERFDELNKQHLIEEAQRFQEAEQTSDLNLPYSVSRAVIEEAFPDLIAANLFEVGIMNQSPMRLYYETTTGETGYSDTLDSAETVVCTLQSTWYALGHGRITPGTVVVKNAAENTTYVEGTDYVIDYAQGRIMTMGATLTAPSTVHVTAYDYTAIREGEMQPIQRVKTTLAYKTVEASADRLADQVSREAVVFSQSQIGWDAQTRMMVNLIKQMRRKVDQGMLYMALTAALSLGTANRAGVWTEGTTQDDYDELVRLLGVAKTIVGKRFYTPTGIVGSLTRSEDLTNWKGFSKTGFDNATLNAAGFAGGVKGLPMFGGTEFPDEYILVFNRQVVQHNVFQPMIVKGPFPTYDENGQIIAADQYYAEEFNDTEALVPQKVAYIEVAEGS